MRKRRNISSLGAACILAAAALVPATSAAQNERSSTVPRYDLMQLSVELKDTSVPDFQARTEAIRSCGDAKEVAKSIGADVKRNRFISATALPADLRNTLRKLSAGQATQVFGGDGRTARVLVLCSRA